MLWRIDEALQGRQQLGAWSWLTHLGNQLNTLGTTWRDQEHKKFCNRFDDQTKIIMRFLEASDAHIPYLMRKADQIDEYLQG